MNTMYPVIAQANSILVDGATGYIGSHLIHALTTASPDKAKVRCLVRKNANIHDINFLQTSGANVFKANLENDDAGSAFSQVDIACHLIGSIAPRRGETSASLHIGQTERFVQQCLKFKVKKIIMVSACGADLQAKSDYHRTKWQAERIILKCGIPGIILRPSLVIGKTSGIRNSKLIARLEYLIRNKKFVPLIAGGQNKIQPIFIQDLIEAILFSSEIASAPDDTNVIMELGGPEVLTLRQLVKKMMAKIKIERPIIDLPVPVASIVAHLAQLTQEVPLISPDQIKISQQDNVCRNNKLNSLIAKSPTSVEDALDSYRW